jgi:hypothetical protein
VVRHLPHTGLSNSSLLDCDMHRIARLCLCTRLARSATRAGTKCWKGAPRVEANVKRKGKIHDQPTTSEGISPVRIKQTSRLRLGQARRGDNGQFPSQNSHIRRGGARTKGPPTQHGGVLPSGAPRQFTEYRASEMAGDISKDKLAEQGLRNAPEEFAAFVTELELRNREMSLAERQLRLLTDPGSPFCVCL